MATSFGQRFNIILLYSLPALLACAIVIYSYYGRVMDIGMNIKVDCASGKQNEQCVLINDIDCGAISVKVEKLRKADDQPDLLRDEEHMLEICLYRSRVAGNLGFESETFMGMQSDDMALAQEYSSSSSRMVKKIGRIDVKDERGTVRKEIEASQQEVTAISAWDFKQALNENTQSELNKIFVYNSLTVAVLVLLPYLLMGYLLATSSRVQLDYDKRSERANANWWIKFLVGMIMAVGILYIFNPLGRGESTYYQFFISVGTQVGDTLPIYIKTKHMVPVLAGFFGWYLHMIGYIFTKLIHHDVISARVYSLLFKKFIITSGFALVLPESGLIGDEESMTFFMFLVGLFPLSAMSVLIEAMSKFGAKNENSGGSLSQLPGISRWQILRLEEEGVDSMASLANIRQKTIEENLQVIRRLTCFWVDIARLYTVVGQEGYGKIKEFSMTSSDFVAQCKDSEFCKTINGLEGVSSAEEISAQLVKTFGLDIDRMQNVRS